MAMSRSRPRFRPDGTPDPIMGKDVVVLNPIPVYDTGLPPLRRVDGQLTPRQARALRLLFDGLQREGATVRLGGVYPVRSHVDAIRWLLDQIADGQGLE